MTRAYNVIDADGHILEPLDLWDHYIDPKFRDRAPRIVKGDNGKERLVIEEHMVGDSRISIGRIGGVGARQGVFAKKELGFRGGFLRPNPYDGKMINHPDFEPFWAAAEDLDFSIGFHEGASSGMPTVGVDRFEGRAAKHIISHTMEMMLACLAVIWGGVCEKHPKIRIGFLESGGGWIAPWLDRMDRHFDDQGFNDSGLKTRPSELFRRNCWISFEPVEGSLKVLADYIGPNKIMWATDYPHSDGFFPGAPDMVRERLKGTSPATQRGVLAGGALSFYGMN